MLRSTIFATVMATAVAAPLHGQSQWLGPANDREAWLEMIRSSTEGTGFAAVWQGGVRAPVGERLGLVAEVPFAHTDIGDAPTATIGNPYVGLELAGEDGCSRTELGARLPLAQDDHAGTAVGIAADLVDRLEAFVVDYVPAGVAFSYECPASPESRWSLRARGGGSAFIPLEGGGAEFMALYGFQAWYEDRLIAGGGVTGRAILSGEGDLAARTFHQIGGAVGYDFGSVRPMIELRVPLDEEVEDALPYVIGFGVVVQP